VRSVTGLMAVMGASSGLGSRRLYTGRLERFKRLLQASHAARESNVRRVFAGETPV
jgi:hypothetical protein